MSDFHKGDYPMPLRFRYLNHDGDASDRSLTNVRVEFGQSDYHPEIAFDYFLIGNDSTREYQERHFPL